LTGAIGGNSTSDRGCTRTASRRRDGADRVALGGAASVEDGERRGDGFCSADLGVGPGCGSGALPELLGRRGALLVASEGVEEGGGGDRPTDDRGGGRRRGGSGSLDGSGDDEVLAQGDPAWLEVGFGCCGASFDGAVDLGVADDVGGKRECWCGVRGEDQRRDEGGGDHRARS